MTSAPRVCPGGTVVCLGCGPSLTAADVEFCRGKATIIAVNNAYTLAPFADALYACDAHWWHWHQGVPDFAGLKFSITAASEKWPGVRVLKNTGVDGLELAPTGLRTGRNSGYQAINLAVHFGAARIVLLGYDMQAPVGKPHFFGHHSFFRQVPPFDIFRPLFGTLVEPLRQAGVSVLNCTPGSALSWFPRADLRSALALEVGA